MHGVIPLVCDDSAFTEEQQQDEDVTHDSDHADVQSISAEHVYVGNIDACTESSHWYLRPFSLLKGVAGVGGGRGVEGVFNPESTLNVWS
jgi:hypothetical protein